MGAYLASDAAGPLFPGRHVVQQLRQDLLLGAFFGQKIRVLGHVIHVDDIVEFEGARAVLVDDVEGLVDQGPATLVHGAADGGNEFVVADRPFVAHVEELEQLTDLPVRKVRRR